MKKSFTFISSMFIALSMFAQTDVTKKYITNPSFENNGTDGWNAANLAAQGNNSFKKKDGATYLEKWVSSGNSVGSASLSQTLSALEPGKYTLTVAAQNMNQNDETKKCSGAKIYAGSKSTTIYTPDDYSVEFTYISGDIEIGFTATNANGNWLAVDNFRLAYNGAPEVDEMKSAITTLLDSARKIYGEGTGNEADALKAVIDKAQGIVDDTNTNAENAVEAYKELQKGIDDYKYANVSEELPIDATKYINNPSFENKGTNGWENENLVTQTNTSFKQKAGSTYLERWVGQGNSAGSVSLSQTIKNLPNGVYKLTVAAQNLDQSSTSKKCKGAYIFADDQQTTVYTADNYSVKFMSVAGEVTIGFKAESAEGNWLAVDNFRLQLIGKVDNAAIVTEILRIAENAEGLQSKMMSSAAAKDLQEAIDLGKLITENSAESDIQKAKKALDAAIEKANKSIGEYEALVQAIETAGKSFDANKKEADAFKAEIDKANELAKNADASSAELAAEIIILAKAELAFNLANATHGSGTAVKVTATNTYVPTGSTEALMRATMTGANIIERGVCWSTKHWPTVLDNRTTEYHTLNGNIYHVRGLEPATVYYLRPYAMNKTYEVAYGEEVKIVTHPKGTCRGTWDNGAPDEAANTRCRNAINQTIEYFNQWTGIKGFTLSGHYGAGTPTADCSYGGWMRIGPNAGNQAIGTVIHETGHGVGVGTHSRWKDTNVHDWVWKGREANNIYRFLENQYTNSEYVMVGDGTHGWGQKATYDWFVNGADKDKHLELQYLGGCVLLYGLFIDGLCPTSSYANGLAGYTYNFDEEEIYYVKCENADRGLKDGFVYQRGATSVSWRPMTNEEATNEENNAGWHIEYDANSGYYRFKNATTGKYMTHASGGSSVTVATKTKPSSTENFQLMPGRTDVSIPNEGHKINTYGYWFTWENSGSKAMEMKALGNTTGYGSNSISGFDFSDKATAQRYVIIPASELMITVGVNSPKTDNVIDNEAKTVSGIFSADGMSLSSMQKGVNIVKYTDGTSKKIYIK